MLTEEWKDYCDFVDIEQVVKEGGDVVKEGGVVKEVVKEGGDVIKEGGDHLVTL